MLNIIEECIKESNTLVGNAPHSSLRRGIWLTTKEKYMKELNTLAGNVVSNYLMRKIWHNTK